MFQVVIYDYGTTTKAESCFVAKRVEARTYREACNEAREAVEEKCYAGAKVINAEGTSVFGLGQTP